MGPTLKNPSLSNNLSMNWVNFITKQPNSSPFYPNSLKSSSDLVCREAAEKHNKSQSKSLSLSLKNKVKKFLYKAYSIFHSMKVNQSWSIPSSLPFLPLGSLMVAVAWARGLVVAVFPSPQTNYSFSLTAQASLSSRPARASRWWRGGLIRSDLFLSIFWLN